MAYTNDFTTRAGNYNVGVQILDQEITRTRFIDTSVDALGSGEYTKLFTLPAGFLLTEAYATCHTAETTSGTDTFDLTINDATTYTILSNADLSAAGVVTATNARRYLAAESFLCIKPDHALATAKFWVTIKGIQLNTSM